MLSSLLVLLFFLLNVLITIALFLFQSNSFPFPSTSAVYKNLGLVPFLLMIVIILTPWVQTDWSFLLFFCRPQRYEPWFVIFNLSYASYQVSGTQCHQQTQEYNWRLPTLSSALISLDQSINIKIIWTIWVLKWEKQMFNLYMSALNLYSSPRYLCLAL